MLCRDKLLSQETLSEVNSHKEGSQDEVPDDIHAFYAATDMLGGEDREQASALAMLHEYQSLSDINKQESKTGDVLR